MPSIRLEEDVDFKVPLNIRKSSKKNENKELVVRPKSRSKSKSVEKKKAKKPPCDIDETKYKKNGKWFCRAPSYKSRSREKNFLLNENQYITFQPLINNSSLYMNGTGQPFLRQVPIINLNSSLTKQINELKQIIQEQQQMISQLQNSNANQTNIKLLTEEKDQEILKLLRKQNNELKEINEKHTRSITDLETLDKKNNELINKLENEYKIKISKLQGQIDINLDTIKKGDNIIKIYEDTNKQLDVQLQKAKQQVIDLQNQLSDSQKRCEMLIRVKESSLLSESAKQNFMKADHISHIRGELKILGVDTKTIEDEVTSFQNYLKVLQSFTNQISKQF